MASTDPPGLGASPAGFRSGFVSLVGRPNTGKSTLLNQILRTKVSITSPRPQTTRTAVRGIRTDERAQIVFVDTPGLHKPRTALGGRLNKVVRETVPDVDAIGLVVDAAAGIGRGDAYVADELEGRADVVVIANKVDLVVDPTATVEAAAALGAWPVILTSARVGTGIDGLIDAFVQRLPPGPMFYPPEVTGDLPDEIVFAELVREKLLEATYEEVPHSIAVMVEEMYEDGGRYRIRVNVYVERSSQKGIVIGRGGQVLKAAGTAARKEIEAKLGRQVYLDIRVKVSKDWQHRRAMIERFGYGA